MNKNLGYLIIVAVVVAVTFLGYYFLAGVQPSAEGEGDWTKEEGIRVSDGVSSCTLLLENGAYRMYYTGMGGILSAYSEDGITWTKESWARVKPPGGNPAIIKLDNGNYRMIYDEREGEPPNATVWFVSAISTDGLTWTKEQGTRLGGGGAPDYGTISVPDIIELPDGRYRMYYVGDMFNKGPEENQNTIRCAVSSDNGLTWKRETISGISAQSMDPDVIVLPDGTYRMFYTASPPGKYPGNLHVYSATSSDGLTWTKEEGVRLAPGGTYDKALCMDPDVIKLPDGTYRMYYSGQSEEPKGVIHILSAKSP